MTLTVATWNLENLFRPGHPDFGPPDDETYKAKLANLTNTIGDADSSRSVAAASSR